MAPEFLLPLPVSPDWAGTPDSATWAGSRARQGLRCSWLWPGGGPPGHAVCRGSSPRSPRGCADGVTLNSLPVFSGPSSLSQSGASVCACQAGSSPLRKKSLFQLLGPRVLPQSHTLTPGPLHAVPAPGTGSVLQASLQPPRFSAQVPGSGRPAPAPWARPRPRPPRKHLALGPHFERSLGAQ